MMSNEARTQKSTGLKHPRMKNDFLSFSVENENDFRSFSAERRDSPSFLVANERGSPSFWEENESDSPNSLEARRGRFRKEIECLDVRTCSSERRLQCQERRH